MLHDLITKRAVLQLNRTIVKSILQQSTLLSLSIFATIPNLPRTHFPGILEKSQQPPCRRRHAPHGCSTARLLLIADSSSSSSSSTHHEPFPPRTPLPMNTESKQQQQHRQGVWHPGRKNGRRMNRRQVRVCRLVSISPIAEPASRLGCWGWRHLGWRGVEGAPFGVGLGWVGWWGWMGREGEGEREGGRGHCLGEWGKGCVEGMWGLGDKG